MARNSHST